MLNVVVLSCGELGVEVAASLRQLNKVRTVTLVTAPYKRKQVGIRAKMNQVYRTEGWRGFTSLFKAKMVQVFCPGNGREKVCPQAAYLDPSIRHFYFSDFHDDECVDYLKKLDLDLGVIAGTYILREKVFGIPGLGSINLHSGKAPEYRGAAPAFWELYNGELHVGITIHQVTARLDSGDILLQELFPIERTPKGDPVLYLERYRMQVLMPNGIRMLGEAVAKIACGNIEPQAQGHSKAMTYRTPLYKDKQELRRRIMKRREKGKE